MEFDADPARFLAADQDVLLKHQLANVFEPDRNLVHVSSESRSDLIDQLGGGKGFGYVASELAGARKMPQQNRKNLVRRNESPIAIHGADAVPIAIGGKAGGVLTAAQRLPQRGHVRLDRLGVDAAEQRIMRAANFVAVHAVPAHQSSQ